MTLWRFASTRQDNLAGLLEIHILGGKISEIQLKSYGYDERVCVLRSTGTYLKYESVFLGPREPGFVELQDYHRAAMFCFSLVLVWP